jgi:DMSO/TMAO reductase YedYZ molybdopterin-dependent catalytic subunit
MISRRAMVAGGALALAGSRPLSRAALAAETSFLPQGLPQGVYDTATLEALPGKKPLIKLSYRPPNYETPLSYFTSEFTPNESFFVRYHLSAIPEGIDAAQWKLKIGGDGAGKPLELSVSELRSGFEPVEIAAVCQCSGNRRGFSEPHVTGVQWAFGAVGNALWKGARLKDVLDRANLRPETVEIVLNGADAPVLDGTPDFIKSIRQGARRQHADCLRDERHSPAALQRLSDPSGRTGLDSDVLGEASGHNRSLNQAVRRLLDENRLPDTDRKVPDLPAFPVADDDCKRAHHRDGGEFNDHRARGGPHDAGRGDG